MKKIPLLFVLIVVASTARPQGSAEIDGYLNDMQSVYHLQDAGWFWENQLHNRLNFHLYPTPWLHASLQLRNRFILGNTVSKFPGYSDQVGKDAGWINMSLRGDSVVNSNYGWIVSSMIDRAWAEFTFGDFVATIGRQRINWGQTIVWNANDIFNSYSYFDVDYAERPGSDAIRLQYYTGLASNVEMAVKIDSSNKITAAAYYRFNVLNYDFQVIGGVLSEKDLVVGTGWSGNIGSSSFRGEFSYFRDLQNFNDTTGYLLGSVGLDYTFSNSLWLQAEVLYSGFAKDRELTSFLQILGSDLNVKNIGFTQWSLFASVSYPISPLLNGSLAGIYYPEWKGAFIGPSLDLSLKANLKASLIFQIFTAEQTDQTGVKTRNNTEVGYFRLKWSF